MMKNCKWHMIFVVFTLWSASWPRFSFVDNTKKVHIFCPILDGASLSVPDGEQGGLRRTAGTTVQARADGEGPRDTLPLGEGFGSSRRRPHPELLGHFKTALENVNIIYTNLALMARVPCMTCMTHNVLMHVMHVMHDMSFMSTLCEE